MPKKIKVVDVNASVGEPAEASAVIVEADPVVEIPNEEQPVQVVAEEAPPPAEPAEQAEPEAPAEPKKKRAPRARSVKPKKREPVEVVDEETPQPAEPVVEIVQAPIVVEEAEEKPKKQVKTLELVECENREFS